MVYASPPNNNEDRKPQFTLGTFIPSHLTTIIKMILNMMGPDTRFYIVRWGKGKTHRKKTAMNSNQSCTQNKYRKNSIFLG
jgi:hypothetical protein